MKTVCFKSSRSHLTLDNIVNILIFLFPIFINVVKGTGDLILLLLAFIGFFHLCKNFKEVVGMKRLRFFSLITVGYFLTLVLSVSFSGKASELSGFLSRDLHFLFAPLIFIAMSKATINWSFLLLGVKIGLVVAGLVVFFQSWGGSGRPSGVMNAGVFGSLVAIMWFFLITALVIRYEKITFFSVIALLLGGMALVLSGTRGAWLSCLFLSILLFIYLFQYNKKVGLSFLLVSIVIFSIGLSSEMVQKRISEAHKEVKEWIAGESYSGSVSLRLEMYSASIRALDDLPLTGFGYRNANAVVAQYGHYSVIKSISSFNHLHNAYLTSLLFNGYVGLFSMLCMLFTPAIFFLKAFKGAEGSVRLTSFLGLALCLGYAASGLANVLFGDVFMNAFYVFFLALFLSNVNVEPFDHQSNSL